MKRTLRRKVIIRETDFQRVKRQALIPVGVSTLYDRAEWQPITRDDIEREMILKGLRGEQMPRGPEDYLLYNKDSLYNAKYWQWNSGYDEESYMTVQAKKNLPRVRLGWAVFEKDLESRL